MIATFLWGVCTGLVASYVWRELRTKPPIAVGFEPMRAFPSTGLPYVVSSFSLTQDLIVQ